MTKSTKLVAALGVAAGIGVAALPFGAFAATYNPQPYEVTDQSADVTVELKISDAVGIAVDTDAAATDSDDDNNKHTALSSTQFVPNQKGSSGNTYVTIGTNAAKGMTLSVKDKAIDGQSGANALALTGVVSGATIPAVDGDVLAASTNPGWNITAVSKGTGTGYLGGKTGTEGAYTELGYANKAITAADATVYEGVEEEEIDVTMKYNFATSATQTADTYQNVITYTVAANE